MGSTQAEPEPADVGRERDEGLHISDVDADTRTSLRDDIAWEVVDTFRIAGVEADVTEVYVYGSWASGDARPGQSDLDVRVVVECDDGDFETVHGVEEALRTTVGEDLTRGTPFAYVDPRCVRAGSDAAEGEVKL